MDQGSQGERDLWPFDPGHSLLVYLQVHNQCISQYSRQIRLLTPFIPLKNCNAASISATCVAVRWTTNSSRPDTSLLDQARAPVMAFGNPSGSLCVSDGERFSASLFTLAEKSSQLGSNLIEGRWITGVSSGLSSLCVGFETNFCSSGEVPE